MPTRHKNELVLASIECMMFFSPTIIIDSAEKSSLLSEITSKCGDVLDGEPTMLPIPANAPPDIPRLQLTSKNNSYNYGISLLRSDFRFNQDIESATKIEDVIINLFKYEKELLRLYKEQKQWNISRLAIIINYLTELEMKASKFISDNFIINTPEYESIELNLLKKDKINSFDVNRWLRMRPVEKRENMFHLLIDVNTFAEDNLNTLSVDDMTSFYTESIPYINTNIKETFNGVLI